LLLCLGRPVCAQTLNFDAPLHVTQVRLPLNHPPVDVTCSDAPGAGTETRYWQKNPNDDGSLPVHLLPGRKVPSCDKVTIPAPPLVVTCTAYDGFVVKGRHWETDEGDAGTFVAPLRPGQAAPPCDDKPLPGEFLLAGTNQSGAEFWGAAAGYVFLGGADTDLYGAIEIDIFRADAPGQVGTTLLFDDPGNRLSRAPGGFDLRFMAEQAADCAVSGSKGTACLARLEQGGAKISMAQCVKAEPKDYPRDPIAIEYPALLSVRGSNSVLRAVGPATRCIPSE
jgi:hypothetical protein